MIQNKLKALRKAQNLTQHDIAEILQLPPNTYQQYETGKRKMKPDVLIRAARFFDVPIEELLGYSLPERYIGVSADQKKILTMYKTLTPQHKKLIRVILEELSPSISMQKNPGLRMANRSSEPVPETENPEELLENLENLPDVPEDI